ncbi:MAG: hypothetical protein IKP67_08195 [Spirochaetales bacterium]|nr:hypothetical protein [Spirochaetales bacterium]
MTDWTRELIQDADLDTFRDILFSVLNDSTPPNIDFFKKVIMMALNTYNEEDEEIRQKAADGMPGGLVDLRSDKPVILLPDLHARRYFLRNVLNYVPPRYIPTADNVTPTDNYVTSADNYVTSTEAERSASSDSPTALGMTDAAVDKAANVPAASDTEEVSVLDYEPPSDIQVSEKSTENVIAEKDIADKLIEQLHSIKEDIVRVEEENETDLLQSSEQTHLTEVNQFTVLELLDQHRVIVLCVGDGVHGEASFAGRWREAYAEFLDDFDVSPNMDAEIADSFNLMIAVLLLKIRYPKLFHFLKGNHENICNETGGGNYAFAKFANEGQMVLTYFRQKYDLELLTLYADFERSLPLFAVGWNFLASHAEPASFYDFDHILNYHINEDVILGLTWTDNHQSMPGTIDVMLDYYIPDNCDGTYYFGGHRPIKGLYYRINGDRYVQFHNPWLQIIGFIDQSEPIDLDRDIIQIGESNDSEGSV